MTPRYLRQLGSGHIYVYTPELAARKDMVPLEIDTAKRRIDAMKKAIEEKKARIAALKENATLGNDMANEAKEVAAKLAELEKQMEELDKTEQRLMEGNFAEEEELTPQAKLETEDDILSAQRKQRIDQDPQIQEIRAMTNKNQVEEYMLREYGIEINRRKTMAELKAEAEEARIQRIFENEE
ncbi:MAG TPA: hypothetical protein ENG73_07425 [Desulfobacterales bacterium]|nr:hypothetical protein [Desulfobacterales bacterium]